MTIRIALIGNRSNFKTTYGQTYVATSNVAQKRFGARVETFFKNPSQALGDLNYRAEQIRALQEFSPGVVFSDPESIPRNGPCNDLEEEIADTVGKKIERIKLPDTGDISLKNHFYRFCLNHNIPAPNTVLLEDIPLRSLTHAAVTNLLQRHRKSPLLYKWTYSSGGKEVFLVSNEGQLTQLFRDYDLNTFIAQERIPVGPIAFSMRVVTFGREIIGGILLFNPGHLFCSNAKQGGIAFDLAPPQEKEGRLLSDKQYEIFIRNSKLGRAFAQANVLPFDRRIPPLAVKYAQLIGEHPARSLLRGTDFIFDEAGAIYALETNTHPGPPSSGMWLDLIGESFNPETGVSQQEQESQIAAELIAEACLRFAA